MSHNKLVCNHGWTGERVDSVFICPSTLSWRVLSLKNKEVLLCISK